MAWNEIRIEKWGDLVKEFDSLDYGPPSEMPYLFRGQSDAAWPLTDSLSRLIGTPTYVSTRAYVEEIAFRRFLGQAHLFLDPCSLPTEESLLAWWGLMQHFGCPTRLLDWSASPFVATYFAVVDNQDRAGVVWAFDAGAVLADTSRPEVMAVQSALALTKDTRSIFWEKKCPEFIYPFVVKRHHAHHTPARSLYRMRKSSRGPWSADRRILLEIKFSLLP